MSTAKIDMTHPSRFQGHQIVTRTYKITIAAKIDITHLSRFQQHQIVTHTYEIIIAAKIDIRTSIQSSQYKTVSTLAIFRKKLPPEHIPEYLSALHLQPTEGMCYQNCILEVFRNGGEIKFGSMGWKKKSDGTVWYEFGGKDWTGVKQFMKIGIANREDFKKDEEEDEEDDDVYVCAYNW